MNLRDLAALEPQLFGSGTPRLIPNNLCDRDLRLWRMTSLTASHIVFQKCALRDFQVANIEWPDPDRDLFIRVTLKHVDHLHAGTIVATYDNEAGDPKKDKWEMVISTPWVTLTGVYFEEVPRNEQSSAA